LKKPLVAIVGRPNVGKSTLFNRIVGARKAIVDDAEGITRDRHFADADWAGYHFSVIDTGGYLPEAKDVIDRAVAEQVEMAIAEADVIVFVVDVGAGILTLDEVLAGKLRKSADKVVVAVNKVDSEQWDSDVYQFYNLGLSEPFPVSAIQGRASGDLLDAVVAKFDTIAADIPDDVYMNLAIIGKENVGKSSMVNALVGKNQNIVTDIPGTTRDSIDSYIQFHDKKIRIIDTAGLKRRSKIKENVLFYATLRTLNSIEQADVVLYLFDVNQGLGHYDIKLISDIVAQQKGILLVANKWDLHEKETNTIKDLEVKNRGKLGTMTFIPFIFTSMLTRQRLGKTLERAVEIHEERKKHIATSTLNDYMLPIIETTPPPSRQGKDIRIKFVSQVKSEPPIFAFFCNFPKLVDESYRRFLENQLRKAFPFSGVPIKTILKNK
jgi:GTP-binding protein